MWLRLRDGLGRLKRGRLGLKRAETNSNWRGERNGSGVEEVMALRILDEFLEDETIMALKHPAYRLHVSALIYCAKNLTDGEVSDRGLKVLQVLLGFPLRRHVVELVDANLWTTSTGGYEIRNFLEFNPAAATVKAERKKGRDRMRKMREKRALDGEHAPARDGARDGERSPERDGAVPDQAFPRPLRVDVVDGRQFDAREQPTDEGLPFRNELLVARLMQRIGDHADQGTRHVVRALAEDLPEASVARVLESIELNRPTNPAAYAVAALRGEADGRAA